MRVLSRPPGISGGRRRLPTPGLKGQSKDLSPESGKAHSHRIQKGACPAGANREEGKRGSGKEGVGRGGVSDLFSLVLPLPASSQTKPEARRKGSQGDAAQKYLGIQNDLEG